MNLAGPSNLPKRVMLTADAVGGVWQYAMELAAGCSAAGADVDLVTMGPRPDAAKQRDAECLERVRLTHLDVPLDWMADRDEALQEAVDGLSCLVSSIAPDLIHFSTPTLAAFDWPAPVVATAHSCLLTWWATMRTEPLPAEWQWHGRAMLRGLLAANRVIAPSRAHAKALQSVYGPVPGLDVIHNGRRAPAVFAPLPKKPFALAAGRFWDEGKCLETLDAAAGRMETPLVLAGPLLAPDGGARAVRHARSCGSLPERELQSLMWESAVFVSASRFEPFGLGVLEAAQRECALVLSDIETFRELWDGAAAFVPPGDPGALAHAVDALANDADATLRFGALARDRAGHYSAARMVECTLAVYRQVSHRQTPVAVAGG